MSMKTLDREILNELRTIAKLPKLRIKDIQDWSMSNITAQFGEVVHYLPRLEIYAAIKKVLDK